MERVSNSPTDHGSRPIATATATTTTTCSAHMKAKVPAKRSLRIDEVIDRALATVSGALCAKLLG